MSRNIEGLRRVMVISAVNCEPLKKVRFSDYPNICLNILPDFADLRYMILFHD